MRSGQWVVLYVILIAGVAFAAPKQSKKSPPRRDVAPMTLGMVTGPETGTYIEIGRDIARVVKGRKVTVEVKPSDGSIENIKRIQSKENAALGIVQSDVLGFLKRSKSQETNKVANNLRMVAPLYKEEVHVLARAEIKRFEDLKGKRVVVGEEGSGNMLTAVNLLALMGVKVADTQKLAPPEGVLAVLEGQADAVIFVGGKPVKLFKNIESLTRPENLQFAHLLEGLHFVPLNDARMLAEYEPSEISPLDYAFAAEKTPTIAVRAVLVSYDFSGKGADKKQRCLAIGELTKALKLGVPELQKEGHPKWRDVDLSRNLTLWRRDSCAQL